MTKHAAVDEHQQQLVHVACLAACRGLHCPAQRRPRRPLLCMRDHCGQHAVHFARAHLETISARTKPDRLHTRGHQRGRDSQPHMRQELGLREQRTPQGGDTLPSRRQDRTYLVSLQTRARAQPADSHTRQQAGRRGSKSSPARIAKKRGRSSGAGFLLQRRRQVGTG